MRKTCLSLMICFIIPLVACQNEDRTKDHHTNTMYDDREGMFEDQNKVREQNSASRDDLNFLRNKNLTDGYLPNDISVLEEIPTIKKYLHLEKLVAEVESDIPNKRIIVFQNNDTSAVVYKSIYIKSDQHLQIVELTNDKVIYDGTIE